MIGILFRTELKMVLRDRRILVTSIVLPLLMTPLMFLGSHWSLQRRARTLREMVYHYAIAGSNAALARTFVAAARDLQNRQPEQVEKGSATHHRRRRGAERGSSTPFHFQEVSSAEPLSALDQGKIQLVLEMENAPFAGTNAALQPSPEDPESEPTMAGMRVVRLLYRADHDASAAAMAEMQEALEKLRQEHRFALLSARGFPYRPTQIAPVQPHDLATKNQVAGLFLGKSLTLILLLFVLTSGTVVATDSIAGEKERGTWETILSSSVDRLQILAAKSLVILTIALLITTIQAGNLLVYIGLKLLPVPPNLSAAISPWSGLLLIILFLPVLALAAGGLLLVSGYARSYREAQMYVLPALLLGLLPGVAPFLPGVPLRSVVALVPVANIALAAKDILIGSYDWPMISLSWFVTAAAAIGTMKV
ncbi:MAG TPA: ABC transporter permease subunit, partial [Verrucomicrobiae bacterium]|nr:ABC transporter permease subunit [Verrucomicrobiae bacterium]